MKLRYLSKQLPILDSLEILDSTEIIQHYTVCVSNKTIIACRSSAQLTDRSTEITSAHKLLVREIRMIIMGQLALFSQSVAARLTRRPAGMLVVG
jgi:hypothetical protein